MSTAFKLPKGWELESFLRVKALHKSSIRTKIIKELQTKLQQAWEFLMPSPRATKLLNPYRAGLVVLNQLFVRFWEVPTQVQQDVLGPYCSDQERTILFDWDPLLLNKAGGSLDQK